MQGLSDDERRAVLGEVLADELKVILECVKDIPQIFVRLDRIETRLDRSEKILEMHEADISFLRTKMA